VGGSVTLSVDVWDDPDVVCTCRTWVDGEGETYLPMTGMPSGDHMRFSCEIACDAPRILWYCFVLEYSGAVVRYLGAREGRTGGEGVIYDHMPPSFQVTVYQPREVKPAWYENAIVYQIFPDRYRRGAGWRENVEASLGHHRNGPARRLVEDWDTPPTYDKDEQGRIKCWDFYGGTLSGIREELPHLREMGFTALYINPIFEAASNHRYDTADYMRIDPMLGTEEDFRALCADAAEQGISIILDGVFNHTGCDSLYFNKYDNYPGPGAYQSEDSPYRSWYKIGEDGKSYCSWWGVGDLPDVEETEPAYRDFIFGKDGVVPHWLERGARGWRLDVADELPDDFIAGIKGSLLATKPDGVLLGEVWEDASNKISYGQLRRYLLGSELDSAMDYPFRTALLDFLTGAIPAGEVAERLESLLENYPPDAFAEALNLLGSHDRTRLLSVLGGAPDPGSLSEADRAAYRLDDGQRGLAKGRLWLAALVQMTMPGVPCVYYGDEAGMEGLTDPCNRAGFPWGHEDPDCETIYHNAIMLRRSSDVFVAGSFEPFSEGDDVFGFWRQDGGESYAVMVNRSLSEPREVSVRVRGEAVDDLVGGVPVRVSEGRAHVTLAPLGSAVLYFHEAHRLSKPMDRGAGVLCHVTSLPGGADGRGTLGEPAHRFVDWLERCGIRYWQVLPVNPTDSFGSPYAGVSALAGNTSLLELSGTTLDERLAAFDPAHDEGFREFAVRNSDWLLPYATFMAVHDANGDVPWQEWPAELRTFDPALAERDDLADAVTAHEFLQYEFDREWDDLHAYANAHGVSIIGDMPMYVSSDSSDVWANRSLFHLDEQGHAHEQAGTPPDAFATSGQLWGNPTYDWDAMARDGFAWWMSRLGRAFKLYDRVRLDHFLGFSAYYSIPEGASASEGRWLKGPGIALFEQAHDLFGPLPVIAEDLGTITPAVRALVAQGGFDGMDVLQFADGDVRQGYEPRPGKVSYTGTHDTQTLLGWVESRFGVTGDEARTTADRLICAVWASSADVAVMPLQDVLGLDDAARMNVPGTAEGNWRWQTVSDELSKSEAFLREITREAGRD
jgi:4-alpha-glucanotransferase